MDVDAAIIAPPPESNENPGLKGLGNSPKLSPAAFEFKLARWGLTIGELLVELVGPVLFRNELALDSPPPPPPPLKEDLENR